MGSTNTGNLRPKYLRLRTQQHMTAFNLTLLRGGGGGGPCLRALVNVPIKSLRYHKLHGMCDMCE